LGPGGATFGGDTLRVACAREPVAGRDVGRDPTDARRLLVGRVRSWEPLRRRSLSLEEARSVEDATLAEVAALVRHFDARAVTDQFKSAGVAERLRRYGVPVTVHPMTAPTKDSAFGFLRARLNEGSLELPEHPLLVRELRAIRTRYAAGRSSVVLPRLHGSHCDLAQALALAVYEHDRRGVGPSSGSFTVPRFRRHVPRATPFGPDAADIRPLPVTVRR
jgi:hypothetical protein